MRVDQRLHCGIVTQVTEWPATIDRRYHDAVILGLDSVITETAPGAVQTRDSTVPLLRRLRDAGIATAVYSPTRDCGQVLRAAGIDDLVTVAVAKAGTTENRDAAALTNAATRLRVRPVRCVVVECDEAGVRAGRDGGFSLVIGLQRNGQAKTLLSCGADTVVADLAEISVRRGAAPYRPSRMPCRSTAS